MMWDWEPSVIVGCVALAAAYLAVARPRTPRQAFWFFSGVVLLLLDLVSPIDVLGDTYLFSAHVLQHFVLALIIPPLWVMGTPRHFAKSVLESRWARQIERTLSQPAVAWLLGVGTMLVWHMPTFFNAALANDGLHIFQHLSFLITGVIFWWPILGPMKTLGPLPAIAYLFSACTACSLLGAVLTFSAPGWYPAYLHPNDHLGLLRTIRVGWGLDPRTDQQLGGMLMWVPGCLVYLTAILTRVARWYATPERTAHDPA
jgi:putative membrane protein